MLKKSHSNLLNESYNNSFPQLFGMMFGLS